MNLLATIARTDKMKILFIGQNTEQSQDRFRTLIDLGHSVEFVCPYIFDKYWPGRFWNWHTGALVTSSVIHQYLRSRIKDLRYDLVFVDNGELLNEQAVSLLRSVAERIIVYNQDNPFAPRDGLRWRLLRKTLPMYDLYVTPRQSTADEAADSGIRNVMRVNFWASERLHMRQPPSQDEIRAFGSKVSFVGTWFPERGPFMEVLLRRGVPLRIFGSRWDRDPNFAVLKHAVDLRYLGHADYISAIRGTTIAIAMLSKGNKDLHTTRSLEIPALGVLMCGERTSEHTEMYKEGEEAVFWSDANECADLCLRLLSSPSHIAEIADAGHRRMLNSSNWARPTMARILARTFDGHHQ